jgi:hypothetical protein
MLLGAGGALVAIPIVIHLLNRRRFKTVHWAAMEFLLKALKKNRRRLRFEQFLLLATRCLVLLLMGMALARPMGCAQSSLAEFVGRRTGVHVFVIDNSYSMAYQIDRSGARTQLDQAKIIAKTLIDRLSSGGESVAIVTAARPAVAVIATPTFDLKSAEAAVDRIPQTYGGTDEAGALALARDIARTQTTEPNKNLYLIDDSTRIAWQTNGDAIKQTALELSKLYPSGIEHYNLGKPDEWNQSVVGLDPGQTMTTSWFPADFVADVRGYGPCPTDPKLTWKIDDNIIPPGATPVKAAEQASPITITAAAMPGGLHVVTASLDTNDRLPLDDTRWRIVDSVSQLKVLIVEGERGVGGLGSSGAFLDTALNPPSAGDTSGRPTSYVSTERISDLELDNKIFSDYRCICLCGVGDIQDSQAEELEKFVRDGGTLMVFMGDPVTAENYNATLYKHHLIPGPLTKRITVGADQPARRFAFNPKGVLHPILADFRNQENTGLDKVEIYSYWQIDISANPKVERVLDFLPPDGSPNQPPDPAITVQSLGDGKTLFYATASDPNSEWTTFMAHECYPALMHMLLLGTTSNGDGWMNLTIEDPLIVPPSIKFTAAPMLRDANQTTYPIDVATDAQGRSIYRADPLAKPGIYTLSTGAESYKIAVNVPPDEADVRTIDDDQVKAALGDIDVKMLDDSVPAIPVVAVETGKDLGWPVLFAVLILAAMESFIAMYFGHQRRKL